VSGPWWPEDFKPYSPRKFLAVWAAMILFCLILWAGFIAGIVLIVKAVW
jgi:ABC-type transport system involved in cytochrome bd biosynthesis fused ATPase/permease subunit